MTPSLIIYAAEHDNYIINPLWHLCIASMCRRLDELHHAKTGLQYLLQSQSQSNHFLRGCLAVFYTRNKIQSPLQKKKKLMSMKRRGVSFFYQCIGQNWLKKRYTSSSGTDITTCLSMAQLIIIMIN